MKEILISTACLPPIDYMLAVYQAEKVNIELFETYARQTWRNRYSISTANGKLDLSVPVIKPSGNNSKTSEIIISTRHTWQNNHWKAIRSAYCKSPYFIYYQDLIEPLYRQAHPEKLYDWNYQLLRTITPHIIPLPQMSFTSSYEKNPADTTDLREAFSPKRHRQNHDISALLPAYYQVFDEKTGFLPNMSIIDLLFNLGPEAGDYIRESINISQ